MGPPSPASFVHGLAQSGTLIWVTAMGLLVLTTGSILTLPASAIAVPIVAVAVAAGLLSRPVPALTAAIAFRCIVDLTSSIEVGPINAMEAYTGSAVVMTSLLCVMHLGRIGASKLALPAALMVTMIALTFARHPTPSLLSTLLKFVGPWTLIVLVPVLLDEKSRIERLLLAMLITSIPAVASSAYFALTHQRFEFIASASRLVGAYYSVTDHACAMLVYVLLGTYFFTTRGDTSTRIGAAVYTLGALCGLYYSYTRAPYIGLAVGLGAFFGLRGNWRSLTGTMVALTLLTVQSSVFSERFGELDLNQSAVFVDAEAELGSGRYRIWSRSLAEYLNEDLYNLFLGRGFGGQVTETVGIDPHMDLLFVTYQLGPLGLIAWLWVLAIVVAGVKRLRTHEEPAVRDMACILTALILACFATSVLTNGFISRAGPAWIFGAVIGSLHALERAAAVSEAGLQTTDPPATGFLASQAHSSERAGPGRRQPEPHSA